MPSRVQAEKVNLIYFTADDELPTNSHEGYNIINLPDEMIWKNIISRDNRDTRLVLFPTFALSYFLHWETCVDLAELDNKVSNNAYSDTDFEDSVLSEAGITACFKCGWQSLTLFVPRDAVYPQAAGLLDAKLKRRLQRNTLIYRCPQCDTELSRFVVKVFENAKTSDLP